MNPRRYLFGPVNSRRLGRSLGVDLLPYKTCSLDCIYCECGSTTKLTTERAEWVPTEEVLAELDAYLCERPALDFVTFSGSGEPTLHTGIGRIIRHIKEHHAGYKVAVLSNGTLFTRPEVREEVLLADLVVPSLDGATPSAFAAIDRAAAGVDVGAVVDGLVQLREAYHGTLALEIFVVPGINDADPERSALAAAARRIRPDVIQLNRLDRPGIDPRVTVASDACLEQMAAAFAPLPVAIVAKRGAGVVRRADDAEVEGAVLDRLTGRSLDTTTLAFLTGIPEGVVAKAVRQMLADGRLVAADPARGDASRTVVRRAP